MGVKWDEAPRSVVWEITLLCNLHCHHCASGGGRARGYEMSTAEALDLCDQFARLGVQSVCLFGGEAILRPDWTTLAERLREQDIEVNTVTNGWAMTEKLAEKMIGLGFSDIGLSLDAAEAEKHDRIRGRKGAFERALRTLDLIDALPLPSKTLLTSVTRLNVDELAAIAELVASRITDPEPWMWMINVASCHDPERFGAEHVLDRKGYVELCRTINDLRTRYEGRLDLTGAHDIGYYSMRFPNLHNFSWQGCQAGLNTVGIHADGRVKGCLILPDAFVEGNVLEEPLEKIWLDPDRFALNRKFDRRALTGTCADCPYGHVCRGGCSDLAHSLTGSPYDFPYCLYRWEMEELERG